jgi:phospholipase/lecithinase/hemolysin
MTMKKRAFHLAVLIFTSLLLCLPAAAQFSQIVAFGDSLTDNGTNLFYGDVHGIDHFSNGDVWVEYLSQSRGIPLDDWAYGGAYSGIGANFDPDNYGLLWQVDSYLADYPTVQPSSLYTVWAGGNDFLALPSNPSQDDIVATIGTATGNIVSAIDLLANAGAQNFLVLNLPDLGKTPRYNYDPAVSGGATYLANAFNQALNSALASYHAVNPGINLCQLDTFAFLNDVINGGYFANTTDAWLGSGDNPNNYLFWDDIHPTTGTHWLLSEAADEQLNSCVPVPPSFLLLVSGLVGLVGIKRKLAA